MLYVRVMYVRELAIYLLVLIKRNRVANLMKWQSNENSIW